MEKRQQCETRQLEKIVHKGKLYPRHTYWTKFVESFAWKYDIVSHINRLPKVHSANVKLLFQCKVTSLIWRMTVKQIYFDKLFEAYLQHMMMYVQTQIKTNKRCSFALWYHSFCKSYVKVLKILSICLAVEGCINHFTTRSMHKYNSVI